MKKLFRIENLLDHFDNPQTAFPAVLISGTKGKGSTGAVLESICTHAGLTTGGFSSPHLQTVRERITVNGSMISEDEFTSCITEISTYLDNFSDKHAPETPSYFEIITAASFLFFRKIKADLAVLEVGMGGRLDATNTAEPIISIVTSIGLEHTAYLGGTIPDITAEKCGIFRRNTPVISTVVKPEAVQVVRQKAEELHAPLIEYPDELNVEEIQDNVVTITNTHETVEHVHLPFPGRHQQKNCAAACEAALILNRSNRYDISHEHIRTGAKNTQLKGRIDILHTTPVVIIDTSHTADSVQALSSTLSEQFPESGVYAVFNISTDKDLDTILPLMPKQIKHIFIPPTDSLRTYGPPDLAGHLTPAGFHTTTCTTIQEAYEQAKAMASAGDIIVFFGSFFLAGPAYSLVRE